MTEEVLYIVSDYVEWHESIDVASAQINLTHFIFVIYFYIFILQKKTQKRRTQNIIEYINVLKYLPYFSSESSILNDPTWTFCIGGNGQVLSVVQQTTLEMRTEKHYNKIIAKATCNLY